MSANVGCCMSAFSLMPRFKSDAIGDLSWSLIRVRVLTARPFVPSCRTRAVITPFSLSLRFAPKEAMTRPGYIATASASVYLRTCPLET